MQVYIEKLLTAINQFDNADPKSVECLRDLVCLISDNDQLKQDSTIRSLLYIASQKMRVFGYNKLNGFQTGPDTTSGDLDLMRNAAIEDMYRSPLNSDNILDKTQKDVIDLFQTLQHRRLLVSAPTSFGKTFLMREIVFLNRERYKNILLVFPTVALLQENAREMERFAQRLGLPHKIVKSLDSVVTIDNPTIYVFTPERALQLIATYPDIKLDFFFYDEIYKIDEDFCSDTLDEKDKEQGYISHEDFLDTNRGKTFRIALYLLSKMVDEYYLAGPNLQEDRFGDGMRRFIEKNHITVREVTFEPTLRIAVDAHGSSIKEESPMCLPATTSQSLVKIDKHVHQKVSDVVRYIEHKEYGKTLLYCTSPAKAIEYASKLADSATGDVGTYPPNFIEFIDHIKREYDINQSVEEWSLIRVLNKGFGMHHGKLPKYIQQEILEQFNAGAFSVLFCTSTIVEGVNTDAQNMIIMNTSKGREKLTPFDIKNIKGRAGRYYHCFIGRVFYMHKELFDIEQSEDLSLNFATFSDMALGEIDLDNADYEDLTSSNQMAKQIRDQKLSRYELPYEVFIKNRMVRKEDQEKLLETLLYKDGEFEKYRMLINNSSDVESFLKYNWLRKILDTFHAAKLIDDVVQNRYSGISYGYYKKGFKGILEFELGQINNPLNRTVKSVDQAYSASFRILKDIVEHKIPKILSLFESILIYVGERNGADMTNFSLSRVKRYYETGVRSPIGEALVEYGFPLDAIRRLENQFRLTCMTPGEARAFFREHLHEVDLLLDTYERKLFRKAMLTIN